jgi:pyridinium-3,5-biscarboxylic acid mononucleotide sulfurtransferase
VSGAAAVVGATGELDAKRARLADVLRECGSVCIGYSGGVDSALLAVFAVDVLGPDNVLAVTALSPSYPAVQLQTARECAARYSVPHLEVATHELNDPNYAANPSNRCYYCKSELWPKLQRVAAERGLRWVVDGSNADDSGDYRPGSVAAKENGVRSPLLEAGLTKRDVRALSRERGLATWDQPASPCLSSRLPYGVAVTTGRLRQVEEAEEALRSAGWREFRVRHHDDCMRIEIAPDEMAQKENALGRLGRTLASLDLPPVLLDAEGYRRGALNEALVQITATSTAQELPPHAVAGFHRDICVLPVDPTGARFLAPTLRAAGFRYVAVPLEALAQD